MNREYAERIISEAQELNNGGWIEHSYNVARLAEKIAEKSGMDSDKAYILGLLHDIGRRNGDMQARHVLEGYNYLTNISFEDGARICLTHTFQYKNIDIIGEDIDYEKVRNIATEAKQKFSKIRPRTIGQASRISGVNPSDISILSVYLKKEYGKDE